MILVPFCATEYAVCVINSFYSFIWILFKLSSIYGKCACAFLGRHKVSFERIAIEVVCSMPSDFDKNTQLLHHRM